MQSIWVLETIVVTGNAILGTYINGGAGSNTLTGGAGNDVLVGGTDSFNNVLDGLGGNDIFEPTPPTTLGVDVDTVIENGGTGELNFSSCTAGLSFSLQTQGTPQLADAITGYQLNLQGTFGSVYLGSGNDDALTGNATIAYLR